MAVTDIFSPLRMSERLRSWPPPGMDELWEELDLMAALRSSNETALRQYEGIPWNYPYMTTPVPRMMSRASANLLFGEPPEIGDDSDADNENLDRMTEDNGLDAELVRAALISSSEGEVWGRLMVRPDLLDVPIIEFCSRRHVLPEFAGRFLTGATFITEYQDGHTTIYRLLERHTAGKVEHTLYRGTNISLGTIVPLDSRTETMGMQDVVSTGHNRPLVIFIPNSIDADPCRGFSDYRGLEQRFLAVNRATGIGHSNVMLTGKKRAMIDGAYAGLRPDDTFLVKKADDVTAGAGGARPLDVLEFGFEAGQLILWIDHMIDTSITLAGLAPQIMGRSVDGGAISGTAMRLKMAGALIESSGKGRHFDRGLAELLRMGKVLDREAFGRKYADVESLPSIERADALPRDDMEAAQMLVLLTNAEAISTEEKVRLAHPSWTEEEVKDEVGKLNAQGAAAVGGFVPTAPNGAGLVVPQAPLNLPPGGGAPGAPGEVPA